MARNIEIKARLCDIKTQRHIAQRLSGSNPVIINQEDIFFNTNNGRLKLRLFRDGTGELISYKRVDKSGPKTSEYFIYKTNTPRKLKKSLEHSLGIFLTVKKKRELYWVGRTRIHIDQVDQLGDFIELEVVLKEKENPQIGKDEAERLMNELQISRDSLVQKAYVDLLNKTILESK